MKAYNCESLDAALKCFINSTVKSIEELEIRMAKEDEAQTALDNITPIAI